MIRIPIRRLHLQEYQSKSLLKKFNINVQKFLLITKDSPLTEKLCKDMNCSQYVMKAQILAGGRGKGHFTNGFKGGVHLFTSPSSSINLTKMMLNQTLVTEQTPPEGIQVDTLMLAEAKDIEKEYYIALLLDRTGPMLIYSKNGGIEIEQKGNETNITKIPLHKDSAESVLLSVAKELSLNQNTRNQIVVQLNNMLKMFNDLDLLQLEVNPFSITKTGEVVAIDAKITFDPNATFRHSDLLNDLSFGDSSITGSTSTTIAKANENYIALEDGNIGCMVNGAGLAMATMDILQLKKGKAANFLDVGGSCTSEEIAYSYERLLRDERCKVVFINIFGGIVRCDLLVKGIVERSSAKMPLVARISGNMSVEGKRLLLSGYKGKVFCYDEMDEAAQKAVELSSM